MEEIGFNDGIKAFWEWLQQYGIWQEKFALWVDTDRSEPPPVPPPIPGRGPRYDPANMRTWPWPEKLTQNTLKRLKQDHDAAIPPIPPEPPSSLGWFSNRFGMVRDPRSGYETEKLEAMRDASYGGVTLNIGDHAPTEWLVWRANARSLSVTPWARVHTVEQLISLKEVAQAWAAQALIVNLEQEATDPRWLITGTQVVQALAGFQGTVGISTEPWMPDNFDWAPLINAGYVNLPQSLVNENLAFNPNVVVMRAQALGWTKTVPTFGTYTTQTMDPVRADYQWASPFGIYTVDDLQPSEIGTWV